MILWNRLSATASQMPEQVALVCVDVEQNEHRVTYADLVGRAEALAGGLVRSGIRPGDRVALFMTNLPQWPIIFFAVSRIGAVLVPINTFLKPKEVGYLLRQSGARLLLTIDHLKDTSYVARLGQLLPQIDEAERGAINDPDLPDLRCVVVAGRAGPAGDLPGSCMDLIDLYEPTGTESWTLQQRFAAAVTPETLALIKYTSGSTGPPKGVMLTQGGLVKVAGLVRKRLRITPEDVYFSSMPMYHAGGSVWGLLTMLMGGGTLVFTEVPDAQTTVDLMERERCTIRFALPPMYLKELALSDLSPDRFSLRAAFGRPPALVDRLRSAYGFDLAFSPYGMTEVYGPFTLQSADDPEELQAGRTSGYPLDGNEIRIVDVETGACLRPTEVGEICMRGLVMKGYWDMPEATARVIDAEGWMHSGDLGWVGEDGYLRYVGRIGTMLKVGGENVAAEEIERTITGMPGVADAVVVAVDDAVYGEVPCAYVVVDVDSIDEAAICRHCERELACFKVPRHVVLTDELPLLGNGKPDRVRLAEWAAEVVR